MLSQAQWYARIHAILPDWWWEEEKLQVGHAMGLAKMLEQTQSVADQHVAITFIENADGEFLDEMGAERQRPRLLNEDEGPYRERIRNLYNQANAPALQKIVEALIFTGDAVVRNNPYDAPFFSRECFFNRKWVYSELSYNTFEVVISKQLKAPYSFMGVEYFMSREDCMGAGESDQKLLDSIVAAVEANKALGTVFRFLET